MKKGKFKILKTLSPCFVFCFSFFVFNFVSAGNLMLNMTSGNVGIGVAVPTYKLDIAGSMRVSNGDDSFALFGPNSSWGGLLYVGAGIDKHTSSAAQVITTDGNLHLDSASSKATYLNYYSKTPLYINAQGGNVGIGTIAPSSVLEIKTSAASNTNLLKIGDNNKSAYLTAGSGYFGVATNDGVNRFAIDQDTGNISLNGKNAFNANDSWLRINDPAGFISGVYLGSSTVRTDGKLEVGASGSSFFAQNGSAGFNGTVTATTFIGALNGNAATATSAGNSDTVDGLHIHLGRNNEANKVVRTDGSGYLQVGYINSSSGDEGNNLNPAKVWGTNGTDSYLRTYNTSALSVNYAATAGTANSVAWANVSGRPSVTNNQEGYRYSTDYNSILSTGFFNGEASPVNAPNPYGQLIVARGIDTGLQIAGGYNSDNLYFRGWWNSGAGFSPWRTIINSGNIGSQSVNYATSAGTGATIASTAVNATSASIAGYANIAGTANSVTWDSVTGKPNMSANNFQWTWAWGPVGNPTYLWGSNDGSNMNLYNPANFSVNHAATAGTADYSRYVYNNGAYSGSGWAEPSDLGVRYANSANTATNAGYASTAGYTSVAARAYSADNGVPSGAIMAFRLSSCPYWLELCRYSLWLCIS